MARYAVIGALPVLFFGIGWLIKLAVRPRTMRIALAAAATTGLIATLSSFSILGPWMVQGLHRVENFRLHPLSIPERYGKYTLTPNDVEYLKQFLPPDHPSPGSFEYHNMLHRLQVRAEDANTLYVVLSMGGACLTITLTVFLGLCMEATWVAYYLGNSGRGRLAQIGCYVELYPPAAALILGSMVVLGHAFAGYPGHMYGGGGATWFQLLAAVACGGLWVAWAHIAVTRRWHPLVRGALHLAFIGGLLASWRVGQFGASAPLFRYGMSVNYKGLPPDDAALKNWFAARGSPGGASVYRDQVGPESFSLSVQFHAATGDVKLFHEFLAQCDQTGYQGRYWYDGNLSDPKQQRSNRETYWLEYAVLPADDQAMKSWLEKQPLGEATISRNGNIVRIELLATQATPPQFITKLQRACAERGYARLAGCIRAFER